MNPNDLDKAFSLKTYNVFNVDQCDGIEAINENIEVEDTEFTPIEKAEKVVGNYISSNNRLTLGWGGDSAYYSPSQDHVQMPKKNTFVDADSYYKVLFHELGHSTGHESRLNRSGITGVSQFGSTTYSKEELVAEMIAVYCADLLNLDPKDGMANSFAYIKSWMQKLTDDVAKDKKYLAKNLEKARAARAEKKKLEARAAAAGVTVEQYERKLKKANKARSKAMKAKWAEKKANSEKSADKAKA